MVPIKVRKFGNSLGVVLPKEVIHRLNTRDGEQLFLVETADGGYLLTPYDPCLRRRCRRRRTSWRGTETLFTPWRSNLAP